MTERTAVLDAAKAPVLASEPTAPTMQEVRELAMLEPASPVLSVYLRTDPRDPRNNAATPGWLIELRNEIRRINTQLQHDHAPAIERETARRLCRRVEEEARQLPLALRARGLAWFLTAAGELDYRFSLQLAPRETQLCWDGRPFVSPLVDVADRGRATGIALVSAEAVRLLHWAGGRVQEAGDSIIRPDLRSWRHYDPYTRNRPGTDSVTRHVATFDQRMAEFRQRFLREAGHVTSEQFTERAWSGLLVVGEPRVARWYVDGLPDSLRGRVLARFDANLVWEDAASVALRVEGALEEAWRQDAHELAKRATDAALSGGAGATGWADVLDALVAHRVEHLLFAAGSRPGDGVLSPHVTEVLGRPTGSLLVERAVEHAVLSGAAVTALPEDDAALLAHADRIVATLRW